MTMLGELLFPPAAERRTTVSLLLWWESRRLIYNGIVGLTGLFTLLVIQLIGFLPPRVTAPIGWQPIVVYAGLANLCYTFGWAIESVAQRVWGEKCPTIGPALFRQGLAFSVGLTLLPILLLSVAWVARVASLLFG